MIPLLVVTGNEEKETQYLESLARENKISKSGIFRVTPEKESIGIDDIRAVGALILTRPPSLRLIAVHAFGTATAEAQNAFLKILEEKNEENLFVLFSSSPEHIIPTILSRVRVVLLEDRGSALEAKRAGEIALVLEKVRSPGYAFLQDPLVQAQTKDEAGALIDDLIRSFRQDLATGKGLATASLIRKAFITKNQIFSLNCNPQLTLDNLLIFIHKTATMKSGHEKK